MAQRRKAPVQGADTQPKQFARLLFHVADTQEEVIVNNLGNERKYYTSFRARINEFRRAFYDDALKSGDEDRIDRAKVLYSVTLEDPKQDENGKWFCRVRPKSLVFAQAIDELLPGDGKEPAAGAGTKALSDFLLEDD